MSSTEPISSRRYIGSLDGVRAIAAIAVVLHHFVVYELFVHRGGEDVSVADLGLARYLLQSIWFLGWMGVDLFFVLSGFLITGILLDAQRNSRPGEFFKTFYARRALRILPLYYLFLVLYSCSTRALGATDPNELWHWAYGSNLLVAGWGWDACTNYTQHLWTLSIEEQFYLIWPFAVYYLRRQTLKWVCFVAVLGVPLFRVTAALLFPPGPEQASHVFTISRADFLLLGSALATLMRDPRWTGAIARFAPTLALGAGSSYVGLLLARVGWSYPEGVPTPLELYVLSEEDILMQGLGYSLAGLSFAGLIGTLVSRESSLAGRLLERPLLRRLGRVSYGFYIIQTPLVVGGFATGVLPIRLPNFGGSRALEDLLGGLACIVVAYALAWASWAFFEVRLNRLKAHFPYPAHNPTSAERRAAPAPAPTAGHPRRGLSLSSAPGAKDRQLDTHS